MPHKSLIQSCKTRWNSVYDMFERLIEQRWAVTAVLSDRTVTKLAEARALDLSSEHWDLMEEILPVLKTLKIATTAMSSESNVSVSNSYPITFSFLQIHLIPQAGEGRRVTEFKEKVSTSLAKRMKVNSDEFIYSVPLIASALDPRHKSLPFLSVAQRTDVTFKLLNMAKDVDSTTSRAAEAAAAAVGAVDEDEDVSEGEAAAAAPLPTDENANSSAMRLLLGHNYVTSSDSGPANEVERYFRESPAALEVNPLQWWKLNCTPKRYLCVPGTSVPSERIFSAANLTVNRLRTRLTPEHVDMLIFLNKNGAPKAKPK
ncbi:zinc finger BED domain-containing protein 1 [Caligus rogercresseyi]|uniref:Zinc finger BED domain-containing protein 1 n=1 Tax=Caligus rogercresseyi TaxID=217165 RepID=A0A7T8GY69_CALRO|nr:zinc finger BED domain-containing protein 1 [Caligus rogercresseyi]QQP41622.1 zinc finger BED domain-containing protein 1 [Caligus rogercresseyi]